MENHNGFVPLNLILIFIGQTYSLIFLPESKIEYDMPLCADNTHIIKFGFDWCLKVKSVLIVGQSQSCDESVYCLLHECLENQGWMVLEGDWIDIELLISSKQPIQIISVIHALFISDMDS